MKSTKIRVASKMISVIIYMMAALGGYTPMLLLAGYVFLYEKKDERLKQSQQTVSSFIYVSA